MLYLIGLGLNLKGISLEGIEAIKNCKKVYLESYTVDFPYAIADLEKVIGKPVIALARKDVESDRLVKESKKEDIALLVYGCPLFATTHETLIADCKKEKIKVKVIFSASIFDAIALTGLQNYKFGKVSSMPKWQKSFTPESFMDIVKENLSIKAHSLILCDIGLSFRDALNELEISAENKKVKLMNKIIVCSNLGTPNETIHYDSIDNLKSKKVSNPFCIIIPSELHFIEKEALEKFG